MDHAAHTGGTNRFGVASAGALKSPFVDASGSLLLSEIPHLAAAEAAQCDMQRGCLEILGIKHLSKDDAQALARHRGKLKVVLLGELRPEAAEALGRHTGILEICLGSGSALSEASRVSVAIHGETAVGGQGFPAARETKGPRGSE